MFARLCCALATAIALSGPASAADPYPSRPIRLLVPFPAGGPVDVMARLVAQQLSNSFGQVIVENRPGGGSTLAAKAAASAEPDGYTLLLASAATLAIAPALYKEPGYDPINSFAPVAFISSVPYVMIAGPGTPLNSVAAVVGYAKANPGKLNFGAPAGAPPQLLIGWFKAVAGVDITLVPYKGAATVLTDLVGGQIHGGFETMSVVLAHLTDGKMRALAVANPARLPQLPDTPTMAEAGIKNFVASSWAGIAAPAGTPKEIIERLNLEINKGLNNKDMQVSMQRLGAQTSVGSPDDFAKFIVAERPKWAEMVRLSGASPE